MSSSPWASFVLLNQSLSVDSWQVLLSATLHDRLGELAMLSMSDPVAIGFRCGHNTQNWNVVAGIGCPLRFQA